MHNSRLFDGILFWALIFSSFQNRGPRGEAGQDGADGSVLGIAAVVAVAAVAAGAAAAVAVLQTQIAVIQAQLVAIDLSITDLNFKTLYQSVVGLATRFTSDVQISDSLQVNINLNRDGTALFSGDVTCEDDLNVHNNLRVNNNLIVDDNTTLNNLYITNNLSSSLRFGNSTETHCAASIEYVDPVLTPLLIDGLGGLNLRATQINIGNASGLSVTNINGVCVFANPVNLAGNGFISMW